MAGNVTTYLDPEREMDEKKELEEKFQPLLDWLKGHTGDVVRDGRLGIIT